MVRESSWCLLKLVSPDFNSAQLAAHSIHNLLALVIDADLVHVKVNAEIRCRCSRFRAYRVMLDLIFEMMTMENRRLLAIPNVILQNSHIAAMSNDCVTRA